MKKIHATISEELHRQIEHLVKEGWFKSQQEVIDQALRRFLDAHRPELMEQFICEDVKWGLHGR